MAGTSQARNRGCPKLGVAARGPGPCRSQVNQELAAGANSLPTPLPPPMQGAPACCHPPGPTLASVTPRGGVAGCWRAAPSLCTAPHDPDPCRELPSFPLLCGSAAQPPLPSVPPAPHQHSSSWLCKVRMGWGSLCAAPAPGALLAPCTPRAGRSAGQPQPLGASLGLGPSAARQRGGRQRGGAPRLPQSPALAVRAAAGSPVQKHTPLAFAESFFFFFLL